MESPKWLCKGYLDLIFLENSTEFPMCSAKKVCSYDNNTQILWRIRSILRSRLTRVLEILLGIPFAYFVSPLLDVSPRVLCESVGHFLWASCISQVQCGVSCAPLCLCLKRYQLLLLVVSLSVFWSFLGQYSYLWNFCTVTDLQRLLTFFRLMIECIVECWLEPESVLLPSACLRVKQLFHCSVYLISSILYEVAWCLLFLKANCGPLGFCLP